MLVTAANLNNIPSKRVLLISLLAIQEKIKQAKQNKKEQHLGAGWPYVPRAELSPHMSTPMIFAVASWRAMARMSL